MDSILKAERKVSDKTAKEIGMTRRKACVDSVSFKLCLGLLTKMHRLQYRNENQERNRLQEHFVRSACFAFVDALRVY